MAISGKLPGVLIKMSATLMVFTISLVLFWLGIAGLAYRLPAFKERQIFEGVVLARKVDMSHRTHFEMLFDRAMVPLDDHTELYLPKAGNPWIGWNSPVYRVTVSASPLMFGGFADAELIKAERVGAQVLPN